MPYRINPPPLRPAARITATLAAVVSLFATLVFGLVVLLVVLGLMVAFALFAGLRSRWRGGTAGRKTHSARPPRSRGRDIEGEYTVVSRRRD
jgi:hypothetical protein